LADATTKSMCFHPKIPGADLALARGLLAKLLINSYMAALSNYYIAPLFSMRSQLRFVRKIVIA
jgi:hypothetical protein